MRKHTKPCLFEGMRILHTVSTAARNSAPVASFVNSVSSLEASGGSCLSANLRHVRERTESPASPFKAYGETVVTIQAKQRFSYHVLLRLFIRVVIDPSERSFPLSCLVCWSCSREPFREIVHWIEIENSERIQIVPRDRLTKREELHKGCTWLGNV